MLGADAKQLSEVTGVTEAAALFLSSLPALFRMYLEDRTSHKMALKGRGATRTYLGNKLFGVEDEELFIAALNVHEEMVSCDRLACGTGDSVSVTVRRIVDYALKNRASGILIAHNHPSGKVRPSQADVELTYVILETLANVDVALLDHYIFCGTEYYSFEEDGKLGKMRKTKTTFKDGIMYYE